MSIQRVRSKWAKTKVLVRSNDLKQYIPQTKRFNRESLLLMINQHEMIYVKPDNGTFGKGVIRVEKVTEPSAGYRYQIKTDQIFVSTFEALYNGLQSYTRHKDYLVQKGVYLLKHQKRRFDIRVMVQKNLSDHWETTAIIGRLSHPERIVTNYHSGGTMVTYERLLSTHLSPTETTAYKKRLEKLGASIGRQLQTAYPRLKEIGVDVAIDTKLHPWVLEVNTKPHPYIYKILPDKSIYRKVRRYSLAYGGMKA
ncbi:YheC/YheD family protein [Paenibacillus sp. GSMTC-2017]|uniref:YheC/YheD family protein n=1 Tax=Paenibacillus sp. GSMTC-2017 TaxID=2794350 RepID=UPI0018D707B2|nr:YheC/YheD family protein [Paenibacillus sp. GSMTC-2017]MBH5319292.1 YheC/YheD family protein [Paenibacillus sp. GSMTC-2017]